MTNELYHHGIDGQKHGIRRFQNLDGSLTPAGRERYGVGPARDKSRWGLFRKKTSKKFDLGRMKGLGEMDYEELAETVMNEGTRTLKQITMEDMNAASKVFIELMGESVTGRKKFIEENAWRANIDV